MFLVEGFGGELFLKFFKGVVEIPILQVLLDVLSDLFVVDFG